MFVSTGVYVLFTHLNESSVPWHKNPTQTLLITVTNVTFHHTKSVLRYCARTQPLDFNVSFRSRLHIAFFPLALSSIFAHTPCFETYYLRLPSSHTSTKSLQRCFNVFFTAYSCNKAPFHNHSLSLFVNFFVLPLFFLIILSYCSVVLKMFHIFFPIFYPLSFLNRN